MENSFGKEGMFWLGATVWFLIIWLLMNWLSMFAIFGILIMIILLDNVIGRIRREKQNELNKWFKKEKRVWYESKVF